jgi:serine/threonine protein kinase
MKVLNKKRVKMNKAEDLCWSERKILGRINSRFVLTLKYAFQTKEDLFLIMDVMTGGDMAFHLVNETRFDVERCKFYAAQVILGLEHLHRLVKPGFLLFMHILHCS